VLASNPPFRIDGGVAVYVLVGRKLGVFVLVEVEVRLRVIIVFVVVLVEVLVSVRV
jgi:hypothetical protein